MQSITNISTDNLTHWANSIRNLQESERTRFLDSLWGGQLESKAWLSNTLFQMPLSVTNVYIFGGWTGILANMILHNSLVHKVRSIDIDPWCESVADNVNKIHEMNNWRFKAVTADMISYQYQSDIIPSVVINTSTEHITQEQYNKWYSQIPKDTVVVAQGNDFFECSEHLRCSRDLHEFELMNMVTNPLFSGTLPTDMYNRFMCIWKK
jgi:hypothetical protein